MEQRDRILVIDDEAGIRSGCQRALTPHGYQVEVAATGQEGLAKVQEDGFALVLLDVMMPDVSGIGLLEPILAHDPDVVCIIITGFATVELAVEAMKRGAYDFISKPFSADNLLLTVEKSLETRRLQKEARRLQCIEEEAARLSQEKAMLEELDHSPRVTRAHRRYPELSHFDSARLRFARRSAPHVGTGLTTVWRAAGPGGRSAEPGQVEGSQRGVQKAGGFPGRNPG